MKSNYADGVVLSSTELLNNGTYLDLLRTRKCSEDVRRRLGTSSDYNMDNYSANGGVKTGALEGTYGKLRYSEVYDV